MPPKQASLGRRRRNIHRRRRGHAQTISFSCVKRFASGAGQINLAPKDFNMCDAINRPLRPIKALIRVALVGDDKTSASAAPQSEPIYISVYNPAINSDIVKRVGPYLVSTLSKKFHIKWPKQTEATQIGNEPRKLISIYDLGTNSGYAMLVACTIWCSLGPSVSSAGLENLPIKQEICSDFPLQFQKISEEGCSTPEFEEAFEKLKL